LKPGDKIGLYPGPGSPPARGRGLKLSGNVSNRQRFDVAPRTGAWIETGPPRQQPGQIVVAPRTGAWIETRPDPKGPP